MRKTLVIVVVYLLVLTGFAEVQADMPMPVLTVEFAPGDNWNTASPTWVNITAEVRNQPGFRIRRGRQTPFTRMRPSTLTLVLDNSTGNFDPDNTSGAYANDLVPMVPIRVRATHNAVTYDLYRGFVTSWTVGQKDFKDTTTTITAIDGLSVLQLSELTDPWGDLLLTFSPKAWYRLNETSGTTAFDSSGNAHTATWEGSPTLESSGGPPIIGRTGGRPDLDGSDDRLAIPDSATLHGNLAWTILGWANAPSTEGAYMYYQTHAGTGSIADTAALYISGGTPNAVGATFGPAGSSIGTGNSGLWSSPTAYDDATWHFFAMTYDGSDDYVLYVDGVSVDTFTETDGDLVLPLAGNNQAYVGFLNTFYEPGDVAEVAIIESKLTSTNVADLYDSALGWPNTLTSQRVTDLLDLLGWPASDRTLSTGQTTIGGMTSGVGSILAGVFEAQDAEDGEFWVAGDGKVNFTNRYDRNLSAYAATFSNDTGGDSVYRDFKWVADEQLLRNVGRVTDASAVVSEGRDATSVAKYATRAISRTSQTTTATEPQDYADWLAAEFGTARRRGLLTLLSAQSSTNDSWAEMLSRELGDLISVENTPVSGGAQNQYDFFVEEINLRGTVEAWTMTLGLSPAVRQRMFTLDNDPLGKLDRSNQGLLGW